ncbi:MAG: AtpZ/AtpI family protein [Rhodospirillales bacterium]|jgi:ATP synthase protein I
MSDQQPPEKLNDLEARISQAKRAEQKRYGQTSKNDSSQQSGIGQALRMGLEMVSAVAVGALIGWALDQWLDTKPWLLLVFIFLGTAAGMLNVYRLANGFGYAVGYQKTDQDQDTVKDSDNHKGKE